MRLVRDEDDRIVKAGDVLVSSYGIPPRRLEGQVIERKGKLIVLTPDSNPKECTLHAFQRHLGTFYVREPSSRWHPSHRVLIERGREDYCETCGALASAGEATMGCSRMQEHGQ